MTHLYQLPRRALPSMEQEESRHLQGRTDAYQRILVLQVVPLDIVGYHFFFLHHLVIVTIIIIIIVVVSVLPSFPHL